MADNKKKQPIVVADNPVEQMKDFGAGVVREATSVPDQIFQTALEQIGLKPRKQPLAGEINLATGIHRTNKEIDRKDAQLDAKLHQLQSMNHREQELFNIEKKKTQEDIRKIMEQLSVEVKKLEVQTAELTLDVRKVTVETAPSAPGAYHLNFFDWVLNTLRDLRKRINESRLWLDMWTKKKKQKGYWAMAKKHGDKFQFSDERSVATAAG
jgi:hypothetical protein